MGEVLLSPEGYEQLTSQFDLQFDITETTEGLHGLVVYCTDLYNEETINRMAGHFKKLLSLVVKDPKQKISLLSMLSKSEEDQLLVEFNNTSVDYTKNKTILDLFEEQAARTPDNIAIVFEDQKLTYKELNERSNRLANYLQSTGIKEDTLVPICIERSCDMMVGILGIIKSGRAFVPIDPAYPEDRIRFMLEDTEASVVLTSKESRSKLPGSENIDIIEIDGDQSAFNEQPIVNLQTAVSPGHLVYVIYTSGSTGKPKGVMIEHKSLTNLLFSISEEVEFYSGSVFLSVTTFSFDISYLEFFIPLITGGKLIIVSRETASDGYRLE